jgi:RNA polymerase sigma factor (TIGR02999 family)
MRRILVDHARRHAAKKRPGVHGKITLADTNQLGDERDLAVIEIEEALCRLAELSERQARVVELRYFGGLTVEEAAMVLKVSEATVARDWRAARAWLYRELTRARSV